MQSTGVHITSEYLLRLLVSTHSCRKQSSLQVSLITPRCRWHEWPHITVPAVRLVARGTYGEPPFETELQGYFRTTEIHSSFVQSWQKRAR